jgi:hypothetical protein
MSGCNQDGKASTPITAPSGEQQKVLLQKIYSSCDISPVVNGFKPTHGIPLLRCVIDIFYVDYVCPLLLEEPWFFKTSYKYSHQCVQDHIIMLQKKDKANK